MGWSIFSHEPSKQKRTSANLYRDDIEGPESAAISKQWELMQQGRKITAVLPKYNNGGSSKKGNRR